MTSPSDSISTATTSRPAPVSRNKSSSALSSHGQSFRAKRNKSSSSLAGHHHNVQFTHHGPSSSSNKKKARSGSATRRKSTVEFGFTSMEPPTAHHSNSNAVEDDHHDEDGDGLELEEDGDGEEEERPTRIKLDHRRSSSASSVATLQGLERGRSSHSKSSDRLPPPVEEVVSVESTPIEKEKVLHGHSGRSKSRSRADKERGKLAKVHASSSVTDNSDWESATDSPLAIGRTLPPMHLPIEGVSGLGMVMGAGDAVAVAIKVADEGLKEEKDEEDVLVPKTEVVQEVKALKKEEVPIVEEKKKADEAVEVKQEEATPTKEEAVPPPPPAPAAPAPVVEEEKEEEVEDDVKHSRPGTPAGGRKGKATFEIDDRDDEEVELPPSPPRSPPPPPPSQTSSSTTRLPPNAISTTTTTNGTMLPPPLPRHQQSQSQASTSSAPPAPEPSKQSTPPSLPTPVVGEVHPSTPTPPSSSTPPPTKSPHRRKSSHHQQNSIAFPSASPESPRFRHKLPGRPAQRKVSNASLISMASNRSYTGSLAGLMGGHPGLRRSTSGAVAPVLDSHYAKGEISASGSPEVQRTARHKRQMSDASVRSLLTVVEPGGSGVGSSRPPSRKSGSLNSSDPALKPLTSSSSSTNLARSGNESSPSNSSSALAALGSLGVVRTRTNSSGFASGESSSSKRSSGYFNTLRGLTSLSGFTTPPSPTATTTTAKPSPTLPHSSSSITLTTSTSHKRQSKAPTIGGNQHHPLISKFVEPPLSDSSLLSSSPAARGGSAFGTRTHSSASLSTGGAAMSRTQQKALLARDAPYWANGTGPTNDVPPPASLAASGYYAQAPLAPPGGLGSVGGGGGQQAGKAKVGGAGVEGRQAMQKWASGLVREAERIERHYRAVEKWRDPLGESLERVLGTGMAGAR